jgi:3-methyladenine DNA glycosylase AlkD
MTPARAASRGGRTRAAPTTAARVQALLEALARLGTRRDRDGMARYGIVAPKVFGVSVANIAKLAKRAGRDHALALALWETGWYEARMMAAFVDEPERVSAAQMDRWCRDFDNWAVCDHLCFHLFDRTPHAWRKVEAWSARRAEFERRAAFALLASLALHDRETPDARFLPFLPLAERAASDGRNFVKKGVSWALRAIGRRSTALRARAVAVASRLAASDDAAERRVGRDVLRDLARAKPKRAAAR